MHAATPVASLAYGVPVRRLERSHGEQGGARLAVVLFGLLPLVAGGCAMVTRVGVDNEGNLVGGATPVPSGDGRYVAFAGASPDLLPPDGDGVSNGILVRDNLTGVLEGIFGRNDAGKGQQLRRLAIDQRRRRYRHVSLRCDEPRACRVRRDARIHSTCTCGIAPHVRRVVSIDNAGHDFNLTNVGAASAPTAAMSCSSVSIHQVTKPATGSTGRSGSTGTSDGHDHQGPRKRRTRRYRATDGVNLC